MYKEEEFLREEYHEYTCERDLGTSTIIWNFFTVGHLIVNSSLSLFQVIDIHGISLLLACCFQETQQNLLNHHHHIGQTISKYVSFSFPVTGQQKVLLFCQETVVLFLFFFTQTNDKYNA